jgi:hypothetical protein
VFVRSAENLDVLALLFKLLSRLIQTSEPDENLLGNIATVTLCCMTKYSYFVLCVLVGMAQSVYQWAADWTAGVQIPAGVRFFSSP